MLTVFPIQTKTEQKRICELCKVDFDEQSFAYKAEDNGLIGICQFHFQDNIGYIDNLAYSDHSSDKEAMIIMLRTAMNFMYRCGIETSVLYSESAPAELIEMSGYIKENSKFTINLKEFYNSPCHYKK